jgi:hypothetical protein
MKRPKCQHFNEVAAKFCAECAAPLAGTCVHCGHDLPPTAKFCSACGQPTGVSTRTQSPFGNAGNLYVQGAGQEDPENQDRGRRRALRAIRDDRISEVAPVL